MDLGTQAYQKDYLPSLSSKHVHEYLPFIEGYAHTSRWQEAQILTQFANDTSAFALQNALCALWERIEKNTDTSVDQQATIMDVRKELSCLQP